MFNLRNIDQEVLEYAYLITSQMSFLVQNENITPTWEVFSSTEAWNKLRKKLSITQQAKYKLLWERILQDAIAVETGTQGKAKPFNGNNEFSN